MSTPILRFLVTAAVGQPKRALAVALLVLVILASAMTMTGFLVIGVLADYLGTGRVVTGLLLGVLFARFPRVSQGKLRMVGLLPKPVRRPFMLGLLALCLLTLLWRGDYLPAALTGFVTAFVLAYPWLKSAVVKRMSSSFAFFTAGQNPGSGADDMVIDGEFREKKEERFLRD